MRCPNCQEEEMQRGEASLKKSISDWIVFGLGFSDLHFRGFGEKKSRIALTSGNDAEAFRCRACRTLVLVEPR